MTRSAAALRRGRAGMRRGRAGLGRLARRGRAAAGRARRWYGGHPLHLLALLAAFGLAGYAVLAVVNAGQWAGFAVWFAVAIIAHDLLLFPLYVLADLPLRRLAERRLVRDRAGDRPPAGPPVTNYVRVPAGISLLLLLVWFPLILGLSEPSYHRASGLTTAPYLGHWLAVTGALFTGSAVIYALRWRRSAASRRKPRTAARGPRRAPRQDH